MKLSDSLVAVGGIVAVCALAGLSLGSRVWWLDLLNHAVVVSFLLCALTGLLAILRGHRVVATFLLIVAAIQGVRWMPLPVHDPDGGQPVTVLLANVLSSNEDHGALVSLVGAEDPDIIGLLEVNEGWLADLGELRIKYPYYREHPRNDNFGIALYSRIPLDDLRVEWIGSRLVPSLCAELPGEVMLTLTHPVPPVSGEYARNRNMQLTDLERTRMTGDRWIVFGDLNATPWSAWFPHATVRGGLPWPTWPGWYGIPIDHVLAGRAIGFDERRVGPFVGSDHRPLVARLRLPE